MHLGIPKKHDLQPKGNKGRNRSILPIYSVKNFQDNFNNLNFRSVNLRNFLVYLILIHLALNQLFGIKIIPFLGSSSKDAARDFNHLTNKESLSKSQTNHGIYKNEIPIDSVYIYPPIEHAPLLRELTVKKLFKRKRSPSNPNERLFVYDDDDELDSTGNEIKDSSDGNKDKATSPLEQAKVAFKENGRKIYNGNHSPKVVLVTGLDFEKFELGYLTKIAQNRVDYAHQNNYGIYIRWIQEFFPSLEEFKSDKKWAKLFIMRAAMHAFPNTKYFWYLDENLLITKQDIDLIPYMLQYESLEPIMIRDQPIFLPGGTIKTYKHNKPQDVSLILTQTKKGLSTESFILVNDIYGRGLLEFWHDPLMRKYNQFQSFDEFALIHILQWHPVILSKTAIVPARTINSIHPIALNSEGHLNVNSEEDGIYGIDDDMLFYQEGDLVVNFSGCEEYHTCETIVDHYWKLTHKE